MATDGPTPPPCNQDIFVHGTPIASVTGSSNAVEDWVRRVADKSDTQLDWHYSGGIAQVLHLGDDESFGWALDAMEVVETGPNVRIMHKFESPGQKGLYRAGVHEVPDDAVMASSIDGVSSSFG